VYDQAFRHPSHACIVRALPVAGFAAQNALNAAPGKRGPRFNMPFKGRKK
jgi:hypothetical protein